MTDISKTSRMAIRKLIKMVKNYAITTDCEKDCDCDACKAIQYGEKECKKLTYIINTNKRCRELAGRV